MGTELMVKLRIGNKLLITYFIILFVAFFVTTVSYHVLSERYLIKEAKEELRIEGQSIAETLKKIPLLDRDVREKILARRELRIAGRFIDSKIIVFNKDRKVLYTNIDKKDLLKLMIKNNKDKGYITEKVIIFTQKGTIKGYVFLMMEKKELKAMNQIMRRTRFISFGIAGVFAIIIGILFQRGLTRPIRKLMESMKKFSLKDFPKDFRIKTGDEIEELSICFSSLANRLRQYDMQQKMFLQNTSHELKTPLMSIQGYAEAIKDGIVEGEEMEESLDIIIEECKQLKKIVEEITYLTKLENVEETFHLKEHCMEDILKDVLKSVKPLAYEKNIKISVEGDFTFKGFYDENKIKRAFINILSNGVRYANESIVIQSSIYPKHVVIHIIDDGEGFKDKEENKVFNRFYKGINGNTGLGLAITKAIIKGHNGEIIAYNHEGKGAVFQIKLPRI
ncbi:HAMP domain-containing histidine kinase [Crassaminicella thermophila]|uniref:histidine kinase n=1 Tax=Crassaminicella thermophila TaxID=2599308 RepID=A0A5C0SGH6_CRATE|nr:HAMP domain-containing sensor histidine kinase [Crassaminicella thermophila]QEK12856.1 HAMP domain-containing histidine kinase [Crassaminicella thermophila]